MKEYLDNIYLSNNFNFLLENNLKNNKKMFIVTANPESFMLAKDNKHMNSILKNKEYTIVPDGIGVIKALKHYKIKTNKIPGVEIAEKLFEYGNKYKKSIYLFGAKEEVINKLIELINKKYHDLKIVGYSNGYVEDKDKVFEDIIDKNPDIIMTALGIPNQEIIIDKYYKKFKKGIFIGVGGSFDVLSGSKKRAPKIFQKLNLEWLYRIVKEPKRIKRFYNNNIKFMFWINKK